MRTLTHPLSRRDQGFSLIEVLISLVILSVGLLGIAAMVSVALKSKGSSYLRTQAMAEAQAIIDRMRANRSFATQGYYNYTKLPSAATATANAGNPAGGNLTSQSCNSSSANCAQAQIAQMDMWEWTQDLANLVGNGSSNNISYYINTTVVQQFTQVQVSISWDDTVANQAINSTTSASAANAACSAATSTPASIASGGYTSCYNSIVVTTGL